MKKVFLFVVFGFSAVCLNAGDQISEAAKAITEGIVAKAGDPTEIQSVKEEAVQKVEELAAKGQNVSEALTVLKSRIAFDPRKTSDNEARVKNALERIDAAVKKAAAPAV